MERIEITYQEKFDMFDKLEKKQLIEMLIECNRILDILTKDVDG